MRTLQPEGALLARCRGHETPAALQRAMAAGTVLEAVVTHCDADLTLHLSLGEVAGRIPREEADVAGAAARPAAIRSRVGRPVCFQVLALAETSAGWVATCSRRQVQLAARQQLLQTLHPGDIVPAVVAGLAPFGAFCDLGRGVPGLLPTAHIAVARTRDAAERFALGQALWVLVRAVEGERITLSHRELLGTWRDNAAGFAPGQTVPGVVRGVMPFGVFVELTPNLCGLCEPRHDLHPGERVGVRIKSIQPERRKVKLAVVSRLPPDPTPPRYRYLRTAGHMDFWQYGGPGRDPILTCF